MRIIGVVSDFRSYDPARAPRPGILAAVHSASVLRDPQYDVCGADVSRSFNDDGNRAEEGGVQVSTRSPAAVQYTRWTALGANGRLAPRRCLTLLGAIRMTWRWCWRSNT